MKEAAITIIEFNEKILLVKRRDVPLWVLPGGGIDENETPENACVREAKEETGIDVEIVRKVGIWLPINKLASCAHVFVCKPLTNKFTISAQQEECTDAAFFSRDSLPKRFFFVHKIWLDAAMKNTAPRVYLMNALTYRRASLLIITHPILCIRYLVSRFWTLR